MSGCELYFAFDLFVLACGCGLGYWIRHLCGRDVSLKEMMEDENE